MKAYKLKKKGPICVYPSSLIQQNHGEDINGHGYVIWNLKTREFRQLDIGNSCGFFTIDIQKGVLVTDISNLPSKVRLRVRCLESVASEVKEIVNNIRKQSEIIEITYVRVDSEQLSTPSSLGIKDLNLTDLDTVQYQNTLIRKFLEKRVSESPLTEEDFSKIFEINELYNRGVDRDKVVRNIRWKPKTFEFSNMFSYGEDNVINFSNMKDVIGIFASNMSGKSSILSALSFCIFDKCDRAFKASNILNSQKMSFRCKFNFEINNVDFYIERVGKADKKGNVKVDVKFWKEENGKILELNGEARRSTNDLIRSYLGNYEDFLLTVLSIQNSKVGNFVDMGQTDRKDLLSQFMGLNIFDELYQPAFDKMKEIESDIKSLIKTDVGDSVEELISKIELYSDQHKTLEHECSELVSERDEVNSQIIKVTERLVKFDEDVSSDIEGLKREESSTVESLDRSSKESSDINETLSTLRKELEHLENRKSELEKSGVKSKYDELEKIRKNLITTNHELDKKKITVSSKIDKLRKLDAHKYDPNCKFCVDNEFVKDALMAKTSLEADKVEVTKLVESYSILDNKVRELSSIEYDYIEYSKLPNQISALDKKINSKNQALLKLQNLVTVESNSLKEIRTMIDRYVKQRVSIENNVNVESERTDLIRRASMISRRISEKTSDMSSLTALLGRLVGEKNSKEIVVKKIKNLESDLVHYKHYVSAVSRDGIPFDLISQAVPIIEKEVNLVLSQIVEFGLNMQVDGKNVITNIVYSDKTWPLEMSSGLERFVTSLVLRSALINISNLPRPNFMAIDEGFGCADADNLASMNALFSILKTNFDFMLIISHLDSMKDMVDSTIEIKKENGFSKITY